MEIGLKNITKTLVTEDLTAKHLSTGGSAAVLATPFMISLMEQTALKAVVPYLSENESTVGTHVDVYHKKAAPVGQTVETTAELIAIDRRKLTFKVTTMMGDVLIGEGTHDRFIIDKSTFGKK